MPEDRKRLVGFRGGVKMNNFSYVEAVEFCDRATHTAFQMPSEFLEDFSGKNFVLFHAKKLKPFIPCMDGLFAAYAASLALPKAQLIPALYGAQNAPKVQWGKGDRVYLLDLTYPGSIIESWVNAGAEVIVLDHHKGALEDLSLLSSRVLESGRVKTTFDMGRSGAVIAWQHFFPTYPPHWIFPYIQDRDLWTKQLPYCDRIHFGLQEVLEGKTVAEAIALISKLEWSHLLWLGKVVEDEINQAIADAVANHQTRCVLGHVVPFYRCRSKRELQAYSDIGNALMKSKVRRSLFGSPETPPFAVVQTGGGWALRSNAEGLDVSAIAKQLGGGGHRNASGCRAG